MAFQDVFPGGRIPVLAPLTWDAEGWPHLPLDTDGSTNLWATSYPLPAISTTPHDIKPLTGTDEFHGTQLSPEWEWNHNPDNTRWSLNNGLRLETATVTDDLYSARNTLTHRILGPSSTATIELDTSAMKDGDRAGLVMLRDSSAWIGISRDGDSTRLVAKDGLTMDHHWNTTSTGDEVATVPLSQNKLWLRAAADIRPGAGRTANFSYSLDGKTFTPLGPPFMLNNAWQFFMGYRFGIFNYATKSLGGAITVHSFTLSTP
jgi:beta-xylosidase